MKKKIGLLVSMLILSIMILTACGKYISSWNAVGFVHSNTSDSAYMSFYKFDGTIVFKLKCTDSSKDKLKYNGNLNNEETN